MLLSAWLPVARAHAQAVAKQFVDLRYEVDPALQGCPGADEFRAMVARRLGYDPYRAGATLAAEVRVRSTEAGIEGAIEWSTSADEQLGERHFASRSEGCREMTATMGFVLAVQIQLMATERTAPSAETERASPPGSESGPAPVRAHRKRGAAASNAEPLSAPLRSASSSTTRSVMAGVGPSVGLGLAPNPIAQGRFFLGLRLGRAALELGAEASLPSTTHADQGGFRHELMFGTLAGCGWHRSFSACGLARLGRIQVHGMGVDKPANPAGLVAQVGPRLAYHLGLGDRLGLLGHLDASYLLTPWTVDLNHVAVWTMPRFSAVAGIDLTARF
jgi:hypothetical protein